MASRGKRKSSSGGLKGGISFFVWVVAIGAALIAFFNIPTNASPNDFPGLVKAKSDSVQTWFTNCFPKVISGEDTTGCLPQSGNGGGSTGGGGSNGGSTPTVNQSEAERILGSLKEKKPDNVKYNRDEWNHWIPAPGMQKCFNVRQQVLYEESDKGSVVLVDKNGNQVDDVKKACAVKAGKWVDPYSGETFTKPGDLDIDHMIPLNYAAQHGGQGWSERKKEQYANDLTKPYHLIAVKASENRSKSDKGPSQWRPSNRAHWCEYATNWTLISRDYKLAVSPNDVTALKEMLTTCEK